MKSLHVPGTSSKKNDRRIHKTAPPDCQWLADWQQECSYYFRRTYHFCAQGDALQAFGQSGGLQADLVDIAKDYGLENLDILSHFDADNLPAYAQKVRQAENSILAAIAAGGVKLDSYDSLDEFLAENSQP